LKVVLFCGGFGTRIREYSERVPKPMVPLGYRPLLWHVMRYYAHFGHRDFVLCLGYKADVIKEYFLSYSEALSNDFVLSEGGQRVELLNHDIADWKITFVDTGTAANIGQRLRAVREFVEGEEMFLANYSDNLTDFHLPDIIDHAKRSDAIATFLCVRPSATFHVVSVAGDGRVEGIHESRHGETWINGGYMVLRPQIFEYLKEGEELVYEPFQRLIELGRLHAHRYEGFWMAMDTFKEWQHLQDLYSSGEAPWELWKTPERR
jgi:glucose-1-phosphate cytidylyltransferase